MSRGKLKTDDEETIQKNYRYLKNELESRDLLDYLYENKVITLEDKNRIHDGKTRSERNEDLLQTILHSGPGPSFDLFLSSLEERYSQVCAQLKTKDGVSLKTCESDDEIVTLRVENETLRSKNERLKVESAQKDVEMGNLRKHVAEARADRAQKDVEMGNLRKHVAEARADRDETLVQLIKTSEENNYLKANLDETREQLMEKCENNKELQARLDETNLFLQSELLDLPSKPQYEANKSYTKLYSAHTESDLFKSLEGVGRMYSKFLGVYVNPLFKFFADIDKSLLKRIEETNHPLLKSGRKENK